MRKKVAFVVIGSLLLAVLATAVSFAAAPAMLGVGRVMCGADAEFAAHVGQTEYLPDGQPVGSLSMRCHENAGGVHEPRVVLGVLVHFGAWLLLFALGLTWALRALLRPGKGIAPP
ncbi:MAG: hypothetical protein IPG17_32905 [Sandaracinaceae bacterium]|jgi:hypothetical protein|nr:hypothetical protein [Sandaracinaceae bacterium]MBP7680243.1 hypothetical protein [Deltaproteobacteria bacterium]MBK7151857.1 hypothetical protein [Sandaracinaceae bacterium]MBK7778983.1 hypothetical protein [Sandaracinaceae bacterium]MBK8411518.1 hypothetical protein [Sandaracinaceae bacterium]